ncbi:hypothetical protein OROMI_015526 [Orobanche minor]
MESSDDEGEMVPSDVSDYEFISVDNESISFATLPVEWNKGEMHERKQEQIFLSGKTDNGLRKIYKQVIAWRFDLSLDKPEISVLSLEGYWIKLLKPRKPFEDIIRTVVITVHFLHYVKWNPQRSQEALWGHLNKSFSNFERRPSEDDLGDHFWLITEAVKRDEVLANSKLLNTFLEEKPVKRKILNEVVKPSFIVDDVDEDDNEEGLDKTDENENDDESDEDDCFDSVCAICDNGGNLYICDGKCMRSFHATVEDGEESQCESLCFTNEELEVMKDVSFYCKNCEYKQHQCFACGKLGSSDESSGPEVFCCVNGACGFFYHPYCVAKLLHPEDEAAAEEHQQKIAAGEKFACPAHRCHVCKELEVRSIKELQFAVCRRCPRAYHRKCLPREIALDTDVELEPGLVQRAWEDLIPNRVLIYCLDHKIVPGIFTPVRNHIKFPGPQREKKEKIPLEYSKKKNQLKERGFTMDDTAATKSFSGPLKGMNKVSSSSKQGELSRRRSTAGSSSKMRTATTMTNRGQLKEPASDEREMSLGDKLYTTFYAMDSGLVKSSKGGSVYGELETTQKVKPTARRVSSSFNLDADMKKRIFKLMKDASSSLTLDQVKGNHKSPSTHTQYSRFYADNVTLGKVDGSVQSLRAALKKLEGGGSIQDAKMVCGNDLLVQMLRWKEKMRVYLSPFLYGMRYTSFGRHFTKLDKLKEIVDMLHWYIQDGDMLVDFCCGSNDFSCLMKKKLDYMGKRCSFKNYDILQAKNDFNFEPRDWMSVRPDELPDGSQLIMGLNPPFGVNAALANKFINKALEFKPKLIILIVPRETERLDVKESRYDLVWEDDQMFAGKSFYLPGSVDVFDKHIEDWNVNAPILYLWSNPTWTSKHKAIAEQHGHLSGGPNKCKLEENTDFDKSSVIKSDDPVNTENPEQQDMVMSSSQEDLPLENRGTEGDMDNTSKKNKTKGYPNNLGGKRKRKKRSNSMSLEDKSARKRLASRHVSPLVTDRVSFETSSPKRLENPPQAHSGMHQQLDRMNFSTYHQPYAAAAGAGAGAGAAYSCVETADDVARRYNLNGEGPPHPGMTAGRQAYSPSPSPRPDYGFRGPANNSFPYRSSSSYLGGEMIEGNDSWGQRIVSNAGRGFPYSFGQVNRATANPGYSETNTSAMQRYAARLDVPNHGQMSNMVNGPPLNEATGGIYHRRGPRPASHVSSLGFAPGPCRPYSQHDSSGWLNE